MEVRRHYLSWPQFGAVVCPGSSSCSLPSHAATISPSPQESVPQLPSSPGDVQPALHSGSSRKTREKSLQQGCVPPQQQQAGRHKSPGSRGSVCRAAPAVGGERDGRPREYTDRLMAAVDAAQLDFTSPLLKESAALPCSEIRLSPLPCEPQDEVPPVKAHQGPFQTLPPLAGLPRHEVALRGRATTTSCASPVCSGFR